MRRSARSQPSLDWELDLIDSLSHSEVSGLEVPAVIVTDDGRRSVDGIVVQRWLEGRPPASEADWELVARALALLHEATAGRSQRPGCCSVAQLRVERRSVDADLDRLPAAVEARVCDVFDQVAGVPIAIVHGDPGPCNIRIGSSGSVGLLDWDESRVDLTWHDLSNLGIQVLNDADHELATRLSNAWEAANGWLVEPDYAVARAARFAR